MKKIFITTAITAILSTTAAFAEAGKTSIEGLTFDTDKSTLNNSYVMTLDFNNIKITDDKIVTGTITSINKSAQFCDSCTFTFKYEQKNDNLGSVLEFYMATNADRPLARIASTTPPVWLSLSAQNQNGHLDGNTYYAFYNIDGGSAASYFTSRNFKALGKVTGSNQTEYEYVAQGNGSPDFFFTYTASHFGINPQRQTNGTTTGQFILEYAMENVTSANAPTTLGLLGLGLIGMGLFSRRRRSSAI